MESSEILTLMRLPKKAPLLKFHQDRNVQGWWIHRTSNCRVAKVFWPRVESKSSSELLFLSKVHIATMRGVLTGDCPIDTHTIRLKISFCITDKLARIDISRLNEFMSGSRRFVNMRRSLWSMPKIFGHRNGPHLAHVWSPTTLLFATK